MNNDLRKASTYAQRKILQVDKYTIIVTSQCVHFIPIPATNEPESRLRDDISLGCHRNHSAKHRRATDTDNLAENRASWHVIRGYKLDLRSSRGAYYKRDDSQLANHARTGESACVCVCMWGHEDIKEHDSEIAGSRSHSSTHCC